MLGKTLLCFLFYLQPGSLTGSQQQTFAQVSRDGAGRALFDPEIAQIPEDILICYTDRKLWDRRARHPASIDNLVAILRKIELDSHVSGWSPGKLAATVIHRFR